MELTKEFRFGAFLDHDVFIRDTSNVDGCDIFYGKNYENWNDLRLGCDICNENSIGGLKINYGVLKSQHQDLKGDYFLLNDVRIVHEDSQNDHEYNMATYWECKDKTFFSDLFNLHVKFHKLWETEVPTHYKNICHCEENPPTFIQFGLEYNTTSVTGTFYESFEESQSYEEFVEKNFVPECISICGKCRIYLQMFRPDIPFVQSHPLKYFWHLFYELFSDLFIFKNASDKEYIESQVFIGKS